MKFIWLLLFITTSSFGQNQVYLQACFNTIALAKSAHKEVNFIKNQNDKIKYSANCLEFYVDSVREELYTKFLQIKFGGQYRLSSSTMISEKQCNLEIKKIEDLNSNQNNFKISNQANISNTKESKLVESTMTLIISDGLEGTLIIDSLSLQVLCKVKTDGLSLDFTYVSTSENLTTNRYVAFNQTIDLADFVQNIQDKNNSISTITGINKNNKLIKKFIAIKLKAKQ